MFIVHFIQNRKRHLLQPSRTTFIVIVVCFGIRFPSFITVHEITIFKACNILDLEHGSQGICS